MLIVETYVAPSKIHGNGVFAAKAIKAGAQVWVFDPAIDIEITSEQLDKLPAAARAVALAHSFVDEDGRMILSRDNAVFFNHSESPNTSSDRSVNVALRDIAADEELTESYRGFGEGACKDFLALKPQQADGRGAVIEAALRAIVKMDDDAAAAHGKPHANLNGYGLVDLFDCVNHPFGSGEHKQQPYRSNQLVAALSDARAALQQSPATDNPPAVGAAPLTCNHDGVNSENLK